MKCKEARRLMQDLFDVDPRPPAPGLREHLDHCPHCRLLLARWQEVFQAVRPPEPIPASDHFRERVMKAVIQEQSRVSNRWSWRGWPGWITAGCAVALLLLLIPMLPLGHDEKRSSPGIALLAQSVQAMAGVQTVHMTGRMRTLPADNFDLIGKDYDFVPLEIWRQYSNPPRWRVEKPGRVVVMNGQSSLLYIRPVKSAAAGTPQAGFIQWLRPLLDPQSVLDKELSAARAGTARTSVTQSNGVTVLTARRPAQGDFTNDWLKNKSITGSDHTCVYRFDTTTRRLEGVQVLVSVDGRDVSVLEFTDFRYNETFPDSLFTVQLPTDVIWLGAAKPATVIFNGPKEAAEYFFNALAAEHWDQVLEVYNASRLDDRIKQAYGGLQVLSIGEPFRSGIFPGYFVPYQVRLRNGYTKSFNLALRNDNPAHRWFVDGGW